MEEFAAIHWSFSKVIFFRKIKKGLKLNCGITMFSAPLIYFSIPFLDLAKILRIQFYDKELRIEGTVTYS